MTNTTMKIREQRGWSTHDAQLEVTGNGRHAEKIVIHGPKGCTIELEADDVLGALYGFVRDAHED
jgi:hypothetical protein